MRDKSRKRIVELPAKEVTVDTLRFYTCRTKDMQLYLQCGKAELRSDCAGQCFIQFSSLMLAMGQTKSSRCSQDGAIDADTLMNDISEHDLSSGSKAAYAGSILVNLDMSNGAGCPIRFDVTQMPSIIPPCMHKRCKECIISYLATCTDKGEVPRCPTCSQGPIKQQDLIEVLWSSGQDSPQQKSTGDEKEGTSTSEVFLRRSIFRSSTKLDALVQNPSRATSSGGTNHEDMVGARQPSFEVFKIQKRKTAIVEDAFWGGINRVKQTRSLENLKIIFDDN
ncbi:hypothetical protein BDR03DRAFT_978006 [Suillus americanus]|nr:hypothetical protein BDR03DRAFT_978006 [Suillus americanus]